MINENPKLYFPITKEIKYAVRMEDNCITYIEEPAVSLITPGCATPKKFANIYTNSCRLM
ncbi:hypothetical protein D3C74_392750 [compost metagenome]